MTAHQTDILYLSLSLALPILAVAVIRKDWIAIPLAIFAHWSILDAAGDKLQELDPERDAGMLDSIWSIFGVIQAIIFVSILWAIKLFIIRVRNKKKPPNQAPETTILTVTDRAPSSTLRASEDRVSP